MGNGCYVKMFDYCLFCFGIYISYVVGSMIIVFFLYVYVDDIFIYKGFVGNMCYYKFIVFVEYNYIVDIWIVGNEGIFFEVYFYEIFF